ncbi:unnamed protein product [Caenorhabditis auriculariae]|uniref:Anaphase-promoting complex subunit 4 WD40 domain-containing protein n=1 Tax=Caenorhabditis auriculariae TaxID=2777116 RepID=A0A8S1HAK1_9PELO|nr:unnamed protein product [Caenorhabditis auriculariae]
MVRELLRTMAKYNEKTITSMGMYLSKKIGIPSTSELNCIEWNQNRHFIATGGTMGTLKIVRLESGDTVKGSNSLSVNQALDGHSGAILCIAWNEVQQKLTTSDTNGLIIVWGVSNDFWNEEMINNRNKSVVVGMGWNCDGTKIAIAYADGQVIVGTLEGNRIWNKDLPTTLARCEWAPDGNNLLFGTTDGEVHVYDSVGNFLQKINMVALETVEMETALARDLHREPIVDIKWWYPTFKTKVERDESSTLLNENIESSAALKLSKRQAIDRSQADLYLTVRDFLVAYAHGVMQLMKVENDQSPIIVRFPNFKITCARWAPNGSFIAVTGFQTDMPQNEQAVVHIVSAYGKMISFLRVKETKSLTGVAWDPSGLRIAVTTDSNVYFGNIRPQYKWGYCGHTVIYVYEREDRNEFAVVFYETKLEEVFTKSVTKFEQIACHESYCILVNQQNDTNGTYFAQLCNGIGTALDFKYTDVIPRCVTLNNSAAVIAGGESYFIWHFVLPQRNSMNLASNNGKEDLIYALENPPVGSDFGTRRKFQRGNDSISALCMADTFFLAACESGALFKISIADGSVLQRYSVPQNIEAMQMNCTFQRIAALDNNNMLQFFEIGENSLNKLQNLDRRDVWSFRWDSEKEDMIALNEKTKMIVLKGTVAEEPVSSSGYICSFRGLTVRTVLVDNFLLNPEHPEKKNVHDIEIKSLRDAKYLLERMKIDEATAFIEKNAHPKLWKLLAAVALNKLDISTAEHAYVKLGDYCGINFCKRISNIQNAELKKAEIFAHLGKFDAAEKTYLGNDRRDLALAMYTKNYDWVKVLQLLPTNGEDSLRLSAIKHVGDYFFERHQWRDAAEKYEQCGDTDRRIETLIRGNIYGELEELSRHLPDNHEYLERIGDAFTARGMCGQAVDCFLKCGLVKNALQTCIQLNRWDQADAIAKTHNLANVDQMLAKYAEEVTGSNERSLSAVQLYRRAGRLLDSAKIVFEIAEEEKKRSAPYMRLKKIHVLGALLIEELHNQQRSKKTHENDTSATLSGLLEEDMNVTVEESRLIDNAWRGAEAYHFLMMTNRHLYQGNNQDALRTALVLLDYEGILNTAEIYSLVALSACIVRQFLICSKAMMKLESLKDFSDDEREALRMLSMKLFSEFPPVEQRNSKMQCTSCEEHVGDYDLSCHKCETKFPICIATGRALLDYQFWLCLTCKHRAYEHEVVKFKACPLCHSTASF